MKKLALLLAAASFAAAPLNLEAGTHTWTGGSTSGLWSVPSNWENSSPPFANESPLHLVFPTNATRRLATNNIPNLTIDSMTFAGAAYTVAANSSATNIVFDSSEGVSWWNIRVLSGTGHSLLSSFRFALEGNLQFLIATNASVEISSQLSAATPNSGLSKDGPGTVILSPIQANSFDGTTTVRDGTLRLEGGFFFGGFVPVVTVPGPLIIGNTSPNAHANCVVWEAQQIDDDVPVTVNQNGELYLADVDETVGPLTIVGGFLDSGNATLKLNGNVLVQRPPNDHPGDVRGRLDLGILGRFFTVETNAYLDVSAIISGGSFGNAPAGVLKNGPGWMALTSPSNTFGGQLYVSAGTLSITRGAQIGAATNTAGVASNATLVLTGIGSGPVVTGKTLGLQAGARVQALLDSSWNGPVQLYGQATFDAPDTNITLTLGGLVSGSGGLTKVGRGTLNFLSVNDNTFTGPAYIEDGTALLQNNLFFNPRLAISGPLFIGDLNTNHMATVKFGAYQQIATNVPVMLFDNGELLLQNREQTFGALIFRGGLLDSGSDGMSRLVGTVTATNYNGFKYPLIRGRLDLGTQPRTFFVHNDNLHLQASVTGGTNAHLVKTGDDTLYLYRSNDYSGQTLVQEGSVNVGHNQGLGSTAGGTFVADGGSLVLGGAGAPGGSLTVSGELLHLNGDGVWWFKNGALAAAGTNIWAGPVVLESHTQIIAYNLSGDLTIAAPITGPGRLTKTGTGRLRFAGASIFGGDNTYAGGTVVADGELILNKEFFSFVSRAVPGDLTLDPDSGTAHPVVRVLAYKQLNPFGSVLLYNGSDLHFEGANYHEIGGLTGLGTVYLASGMRLVTGWNNSNTWFNGAIIGGGPVNHTNLVKYGIGTFDLGADIQIGGMLHVGNGTVLVQGQQNTARYEVTTPGEIGGDGYASSITMRGGSVAPGHFQGTLHAGAFNVMATNELKVELNGPTLGSYDQLEVDNAPDLDFTKLAVSIGNGFNPTNGQQFLVLRNNTGAPIDGRFTGLAEGVTFPVDAERRLKITYLGGDGNDVVLTVAPMEGKFKGITTDGSRATITGCGTPGATYFIEANTDLGNAAGWATLGTLLAGPDGMLTYTDADMRAHAHRFFRFVAQ